MRAYLVGLVGVMAACAGTAPASHSTAPDKKAARAAKKQVRGIVSEVYHAVRRGRVSTLQTLLASDVFVVGPRASDVFSSRGDTIVAGSKRLRAKRHRVASRGLIAVAAATGKSGWITDRVRLDYTNYNLASVVAEVDGIWYVIAVHLARVGGKVAARATALPAVSRRAPREVMALVHDGFGAPKHLVAQLAKRKYSVVMFGPRKWDYARGTRHIRRLFRRRKLGKKPLTVDGPLRAGVTPDGAIAYVAANVHAKAGKPRRLFLIYERTKKGWKLMVMQWASAKRK